MCNGALDPGVEAEAGQEPLVAGSGRETTAGADADLASPLRAY